MPTLPRTSVSNEGINPVDIAGAVSMLRFDTIKSVKWEIRPSVGIVAKDVNRLGMDIRSFRVPLAAIIRQVMIPSIRANFAEQGRPKWAPLAESTVQARHATGPILNRTGKLLRRARQFNIWTIGATSATIRKLPDDVFYGAYHQSGAERETGSGSNTNAKILANPKSKEARALIAKFLPRARSELGPKVSDKHVLARALGMALDTGIWSLPARPFIMYQESDIPKMEAIFGAWMTDRAKRVGRFNDRA
jgi:phage gpG-like protein